jgi:hypothetical protein
MMAAYEMIASIAGSPFGADIDSPEFFILNLAVGGNFFNGYVIHGILLFVRFSFLANLFYFFFFSLGMQCPGRQWRFELDVGSGWLDSILCGLHSCIQAQSPRFVRCPNSLGDQLSSDSFGEQPSSSGPARPQHNSDSDQPHR